MSDSPREGLSPRDGDLEPVCQHFASAWKNGQRPCIEDFLSQCPSSQRAALLSRLIQIELDIRRLLGEAPTREEYEQRFGREQFDWPSSEKATQSADTVAYENRPPMAEKLGSNCVASRLRCPNCHYPLPGECANGEAILCPACGSSCRIEPMSEPTTVAELRILGRFQLLDNVGQGAFGAVWRARDTHLDRIVALKVPHPGLLSESGYLNRFEREARTAAQLRHSGIVRLYEVVVVDGVPVLVSDFIEGVTLKDYLEVHRLTSREAAGLVAEIADALHYAHTMKLVHRDIKPGNIMLERPDRSPGPRVIGKPIIVDFGLALRSEAEIVMTVEGQIVGTPAYMSPEQADGKSHDVDARSDVYSLGVVLYELICGERPFRGSKGMLVHQVLSEEPRAPRRIKDHIPRDLETICLKAMAKQPAKRYATAGEFAADLRRFLGGEPILARPVGRLERLARLCRRNPLVASLIAAFLFALMAGILTTSYYAVRAIAGERAAIDAAENAKTSAAAAIASAARERQERLLSNHRYYAALTNQIQRDWQEGQIKLVRQKLQDLKPRQPEDPDLRSFEWHFLDRCCQLELRTLPSHGGGVQGVACSPDGRCLASAGEDGGIHLWDMAMGQMIRQLPGHRGGAWCVAYSPDGKLLASSGRDQTIRVWGLDSGQECWSVPTSELNLITGLAFSPDSQRLAAPSDPQTVRVWDIKTGKELLALPTGPKHYGFSAVFSADGSRLASSSYSTVKIWDARTGKELHNIPTPQGIYTVCFSPDGRRLASAESSNIVRVWDVEEGRELKTLAGHNAWVLGLAFSPDNQRLATCSEDGTVKLWDLQTGLVEPSTLRGHTDKVFSVAFDREGWRLISGSADGTIKIWEIVSEQDCLTFRGHERHVWSVAFSPDGKRLASGSADPSIRVWDVESGVELFCIFGHAARDATLAFSPDGRLLAAAGRARRNHGSVFPGRIGIWEAATGRELRTLDNHPGSVNSLAFCRDGRLASAEDDGTVRFYDPHTGKLQTDLKAHDKPVLDVAFSPDGKLMATCSAGGFESGKPLPGEVRIWNVGNLLEAAKPVKLPAFIQHLAFSHDSQLLAGAGSDQRIHLWNAATLQEKNTLSGHNNQVYQVAFSPDDLRIVSTSLDHTFKIWDTMTGMEMLNFPAHAVAVLGLAFSPDGRRLATSGYDYLVKLWDATPRTQESIDRREALSLVTFQFTKGLSSDEVKARIQTAAGISESVRRRALVLVGPYERSLRSQVVIKRARGVIDNKLPKQDVLDDIRNDKIISEQFKSDVLRFVEDTGFLHWCSRAVVSVSKLVPSEYRLALHQAEVACRAEPANTTYLTTFGMAQYRLGLYKEALTTLTRAARSNNSMTLDPMNLAVQAMARFRLGQKNEAMNQLDQLRALLKTPNAIENKETRALLREAAKLIEQTD